MMPRPAARRKRNDAGGSVRDGDGFATGTGGEERYQGG